jgi:molybdate transport system substrate-binding protein
MSRFPGRVEAGLAGRYKTDMPSEPSDWSSDWTVGVRVWIERAGRAVLGKGRLELLEGIDRWRSISKAARQMGMSYRRAWLLVQSINQAAGEPVVEATTGGTHGGGARLTPRGRTLISTFRNLQTQVLQTAANLLPHREQSPRGEGIHVAAAVSLEEVLGQLLADYALLQPTVRVRAVFGASDELADHLLAGAPGDLFLTADEQQLERLDSAGCFDADSRTVLAENRLAAIGPADRTVAVRRPRELLGPDVAHVAVAEPASPLGGYTRAYLDSLGLYAALLPRMVLVDNSRAVVAAVHAGRVDAGLVYASDAVTAHDCQILFRARRGSTPIRYVAGIVRRGQQAEQARALLHFLASSAAARRFRRCGFLPARG